ncbi:ubiquinone anaerobic biosynthesis accessory factor UbiT [Celeribacter sp.]|uniref:ubiquinone anaerobic biosynthesis accessory factor UbiT n=1 Tax=Celeribacter sp. TaxID=1890673 RepID=UPI003A9151E3
MSASTLDLPRVPRLPATSLWWTPLAPLSVALSHFAQRIAKTHAGMFRRLGIYGHARFVLDPTDLPVTMLLEPNGGAPRVHLSRGPQRGDARISGPLSGLLGLIHGTYDGDALFFSRDLMVEGDTAAVLALRNAIDDAELDLSAQAQAMSGRLAPQVRWMIETAEARTGVPLSRHEEVEHW